MDIPTLSGPAPRAFALATVLSLAFVTAHAGNCEDIRARIDAKIKTTGVEKYTLTIVDAGASAPGKVVGSCALGTKKIVYDKDASANATPAAPPAPIRSKTPSPNSSTILTECKDGSVSVGGDCRK